MSDKKNIRALIIDDDHEDTMIVRGYLNNGEKYSIAVENAGNLIQALEKLTSGDFDIVFLDNLLGSEATAKEAMECFRENAIDTPIVIVTGFSDQHLAVELMKLGAYDYITKDNLTTPILEKTIANTLDRYTLRASHHQAEQKWGSLTANTNDTIIIADTEGIIQYINKTIPPDTPETVIGKSLYDYIIKEHHDVMRRSLEKVYKTTKPDTFEVIFDRPQLGTLWLSTKVVPLKTDTGISSVMMFASDITDRKQTEQALKESETKYRLLFEESTEGILVADIETHQFTYANPAICRMLGYSEEELLQMTVSDIHPKDNLADVLCEFRAQAEGIKSLASDVPCLRKDGAVIYTNINTTKVLINKREYNVGFFTNLTERKKAEDALRRAGEELESRVQQRTAELATANRELKKEIDEREKAEARLLIYQRQLRSLAWQLSLAEERQRRKIATDIHDRIGQNLAISKMKLEELLQLLSSGQEADQVAQIRNIIGKIIESTRSLTFELSPPVLYELGLESAVEWLVRQTRHRHGLSTSFSDDGDAKPLNENARILLFQTVRELLVNVEKHSQAHNAYVTIQRDNHQIRIVVEDDGVGFELPENENHDYGNSGYGLFSIRERLGHIGGNVSIDSAPGRGTKITLLAPLMLDEDNTMEKDK